MAVKVQFIAPVVEEMRTGGRTTMFAITAAVAASSRPAWGIRQPMAKATTTQKRKTALLVPSKDTKSKARAMELTAIPARFGNVDRSPPETPSAVDPLRSTAPLRASGGHLSCWVGRFRCALYSALSRCPRGRSMDFSPKDPHRSGCT